MSRGLCPEHRPESRGPLGSLEPGEAAPRAQSCHRCCRAHDCCYRNLKSRGCRNKFLKYNVTYQEGQIVCGKKESDNASQPAWLTVSLWALRWATKVDTKGQCSCLKNLTVDWEAEKIDVQHGRLYRN